MKPFIKIHKLDIRNALEIDTFILVTINCNINI